MKLQELFSGIEARLPAGAEHVDVRSLAVDSRAVQTGSLFAAHAVLARYCFPAQRTATAPVENDR